MSDWPTYWQKRGMPWRHHPELTEERKDELHQWLISSDAEHGQYPFSGKTLSRVDLEYLLATHGQGKGPVNWRDPGERERDGLDLRGADLRGVDLSGLPLTRMLGGLPWNRWKGATPSEREAAAVHLEGATLRGTHLEGARLQGAHLEGALLDYAYLQETHFRHAHLAGISLRGAFLGGTDFARASLCDEKGVGPQLAGVKWRDTDVSDMDWTSVRMLRDEIEAHQQRQKADYARAISAYRQLAALLRAAGQDELAARFLSRSRLLHRTALWHEMSTRGLPWSQRLSATGAWGFSWLLSLVAGYGYHPERCLLTSGVLIMLFQLLYLTLDPSLNLIQAAQVSFAAFVGRGFPPGNWQPHDLISWFSLLEAALGILVEIALVVALTQRLFLK